MSIDEIDEGTMNTTEVMSNLDKFRLGQDFQEFAGTEKVPSAPEIRRPKKLEFIRTHTDPAMTFEAALLEVEEGEDKFKYLVSSKIAKAIQNDVRISIVRLTINLDDTVFIWPLNHPGIGKSNRWNESAWQASERAKDHWIRVTSNMTISQYEIIIAPANYHEPNWPKESFEELIKLAFKDRMIDSHEHPVLQKIRGEI